MTRAVSPVRIGLVGLGPWGLRHAATLAECDGARLIAVATTRLDAAAGLPEDVRVHNDWRSLLKNPEVDAVVIATPPGPRIPIAKAAIELGLPTLLEKPAAWEPQALQRLSDQAAARKVLLSVNHLHLYAPAFVSLREAVESAGGPQRIESAGGGPGPHRVDYSALWDYGPHDLSMVGALVGRAPDLVHAQRLMTGDSPQDGLWRLTLVYSDAVRGEEDAAASCSDLTATIHVGNVMREKTRLLSVETARGRFVYDDRAEVKAIHAPTDGECRPLPYDADLPLAAALGRFAALVAQGATADPDLPAAIDVLRVLAAAEESMKVGAPVALTRTRGPER